MVSVLRMTDLDLAGKRVLIRDDLNVPRTNGVITEDTRIRASLPTMKAAHARARRVMVMSHLGRPEEGVPAGGFSLAPVAARLSELLGLKVRLSATGWMASPASQARSCCSRTALQQGREEER